MKHDDQGENTILIDAHRVSDNPVVTATAAVIWTEHTKANGTPRQDVSRKKYTLKRLLVNLLASHAANKPLSVPLGKQFYGPGTRMKKLHFTYRNLMPFIRHMSEVGYIKTRRGVEGRSTEITPSARLRHLFTGCTYHDVRYDLEYASVLSMTSKQGSKRIHHPVPRNEWTRKAERHMRKINAAAAAALTYEADGVTVALPPMILRRVFCRESIKAGGRIYAHSHGQNYQCIPSEARATLHINGAPTVELDYDGIHPHLLYAIKGIQHDGRTYALDDPAPRSLVKLMWLTALNASCRKSALQAVHKEGGKAGDKSSAKAQALSAAYHDHRHRLPEIMDALYRANQPIQEYIASDIGVKLQRMDSDIMTAVVRHFASQGVPALPVHDSCIVEAQHMAELRCVMAQKYTEHTGGYSCPVSKK